MVARNMYRLIDINVLKKVVHQVGFIYKRLTIFVTKSTSNPVF